jgi:DNA-binding transcriptional MerR regulator
VRISDLARQSGLPVATIKFYLREGLLPPGAPISRTQADYNDAHLERLRLIKALRDIADLPVATVGTVLAAVDDVELPLLDLLGVTQTAVAGSKTSGSASEAGVEHATRLLADLGWTLMEGSPLVDSLARVLDALRGEGEPVDAEYLKPWADAARAVAEVEMDHIPVQAPRAETAHVVAVGTVIYGELLAQLRLAAQEAVSLVRFGPDAHPAHPSSAAQPGQALPSKARPTKTGTAKAGAAKAGAAKAGAAKAGAAKAGAAKSAVPKVAAKSAATKAAATKPGVAKSAATARPKKSSPAEAPAVEPLSRRAAGQRRSRG